MTSRLVISATGLLWAGGSGLESLAPFVRAPRLHSNELQRIRAEDGGPLYGAAVDDAAIAALAPAESNRAADRFGKLNVAGVKATALAAGFEEEGISAGGLSSVALVLSTTFGPWDSINRFVFELIDEGPMATSPRIFPNTVPNSAQGRVAITLGMKGPSTTLTGVPALTHAFDLFQLGRAEQLIAGGADELNSDVLAALSADGTLAPQSANPRGGPFVPDSPGAIAGEAFAGFFCESSDSAQRRGVSPLGTIYGYSIASDGRLADSFAQADPKGHCFARAMQTALSFSDVPAKAIDAVVAAANGCARLDAGEQSAIQQVFGDRELLVVAPKQTTAECFGASSALSVVAGLILLRDAGVRHVMVNSVDIGGNCTSTILGW